MPVTSETYTEAREPMQLVLQMPEAERKTILNMMRGAVAISDLYRQERQEARERVGA